MPTNSPAEGHELVTAAPPPPGLAEQLQSLFGGSGQLDGFSPAGWAAFVEYRDKFTKDLGSKADEIARRRDGTAVDRGDVKEAYRSVVSANGGLDKWSVIFQLSGILVAILVTMAVTRAVVPGDAVPHPNLWNTIEVIAAVLSILGYGAVVINFRRRRK